MPCIRCQVLSLEPRQVVALPLALRGLRVALRIAPGTAVPAEELAELRHRGASPFVHVTGAPASDDPLLAALVDGFVFEPASRDFDRLAFELKRALTAARGQRAAAHLVVSVAPETAAALRTRGLEPYVDAFVDPPSPLRSPEDVLAAVAGDTIVRVLPEDGVTVSALVAAAASAADWFPAGLVAATDRPLQCGEGRRLPAYLNAETLDLVAVSGACRAPAVVTSDVPGVTAERIDVGALSAFRIRAGTGDRFAEGVTVGAPRALTVEEIVARHQAFAARQSAAVRTDIATGSMTLTFEAPGFVAPVSITARTEIYRDAHGVDVRQADIRVNGVPFTTKDGVPHLPIIEPERVVTLPLTITFTKVYRYARAGRDSVDGHPCYLVDFTPQGTGRDADAPDAKAALFSGRAWIDEQTFAIVRVAATQTGLTGPIVASEQTDSYAPDAAGRWLLTRSDIRQTYEGASVRTPIHRLLQIERHDIDAADFAARRQAAFASTDVILRDTPEGFRYLKRTTGSAKREAGDGKPEAGNGKLETDADITRELASPVTRIRTFAAGVIVDPNISTPLPFAGLSYVDFDLFHTGTQFSGFYGGSYGQLAFSAPSVRGTRWQVAGRAFAIASSYNDRAFVEGREIYTSDIRQRPAQVAVWALRPITARAALRFEYDWDYNRFARGEATDPAFVIPANQNAHGLRAGLDLQRAGWQLSLWASHTIRAGWHSWGVPGSEVSGPDVSGSDVDADSHATFQRFGASALRTASLSPRVATRIDASVVGGRDLDRFSRVSFGTFDNRLHGYPSALIRYDRGGVLRSAVSWAAAKAVRLDGFADAAAVHDPAFGRGLRPYLGFGAALECPAPFGTLLAAEWGYGVQGVDTDGRTGTHVVRITAYKVF